jgi:hypothetical protein
MFLFKIMRRSVHSRVAGARRVQGIVRTLLLAVLVLASHGPATLAVHAAAVPAEVCFQAL